MAFCVTHTPNPTQRRRRTRDNAVPLNANEMTWPSPRRLRSTPKRPPPMGRRTSPSRSPSPAPSPRVDRGRTRCLRLLPTGLALAVGVAVLTVAVQVPLRAPEPAAGYAEVRLADRVSEIDTTKLMSTRADGRKGVMYRDGRKDTAPGGWAQGLLNKFTRQALRNATHDADASRRRREGSDVPPGDCVRVSDDYLQVRDARFEAFAQRGPSGAMAAKALNSLTDGWAATLMHEMVVGCSASPEGAPSPESNPAQEDSDAAGMVTIWWALGDEGGTAQGAAFVPSADPTKPPELLEAVAPGDAILAVGRELSDTSAGPVPAVGAVPAVFWWYGMTLAPAPVGYRRSNADSHAVAVVPEQQGSQADIDPETARAAADAAETASALQPVLMPWPIISRARAPVYTEPGYTNIALPLVQQLDANTGSGLLRPTAEAVKRIVSTFEIERRAELAARTAGTFDSNPNFAVLKFEISAAAATAAAAVITKTRYGLTAD
jgi:hypothetical protein